LYPSAYGNYVLLDRIGAGGMSEIDLARRAVEDAGYVRFLVIKRIKTEKSADPSTVRMFKDEGRICAELHHSNIAQLYDFGRNGNEYYLVLEYIPGMDVRTILAVIRDRGHFVPLKIALRICCDVLEGLHYAHSKLDTFGRPMSIVHRDVNPRNIMVSTRGEVKLIDFGVAKARDRLERTETDHVKGKFAYMAPEQMSGREVDARADLFSVGLTLHELVSGRSPFVGLTQVQIMHRVLAGQIPPVPSHPDLPDPGPLRAIQARALAVKREDRYADCERYARELESLADTFGGLASRTDVAEFLGRVDPHLEQVLNERMTRYAGPLLVASSGDEAPRPEPLEEVEEPIFASPQPSGPRYSTLGVAVVAGVALFGAMGAITAGIFLVVVLLATSRGIPVFPLDSDVAPASTPGDPPR
jgi:serine/threonine protein kinase